MMTRQMLSTVSSGRMPRWRGTRRRIMSAARAGRNAVTTRRAALLGLSHRNQPVDDIATRHQEAVDLLVDGVDLFAQHLERGWRGGRLRHLPNLLDPRGQGALRGID